MLTIEELIILREALEIACPSLCLLNREFSEQIQEIERKLNTMMQVQGTG